MPCSASLPASRTILSASPLRQVPRVEHHAFGAGQEDDVGLVSASGESVCSRADAGAAFQRIEIGEVRWLSSTTAMLTFPGSARRWRRSRATESSASICRRAVRGITPSTGMLRKRFQHPAALVEKG